MTIERRGGFSESREAGVPLIKAIFGERVWVEMGPTPDSWSRYYIVKDADTIDLLVSARIGPGWWGRVVRAEVTREQINNIKSEAIEKSGVGQVRWKPSPGDDGKAKGEIKEYDMWLGDTLLDGPPRSF